MRKVFLVELPKHKNRGVDWSKSKNHYVNFIYDDSKGTIFIKDIISTDIRHKKLLVLYNNKESIIDANSFKKAQLGCVIGKYNKDFIYNIGDCITDKKRDITIIEKKKINRRKFYKIKCNKCQCETDDISESSISHKGSGCPVCSRTPKRVVIGINDIYTTDPWMVDYFVNKDDAYKYTFGSEKKILMKCPYCNKEKFVKINQLKRDHRISCICNSTNVSYPEKFMSSLLDQLKIDYIFQFSPEWANKRKYDFYIKEKFLIIETDGGLGHGHENYRNKKMTPTKSKQIDDYKDKIALEHGIKVIRVDCLHSSVNYLKESILSSELFLLIDLSKVDWDKCALDATKNIVYEVCAYKNSHTYLLIKDIANHFNIGKNTIINYLKEGSKFGWCFYDKNFEMEKRFTKLCVNNKYYFSSQKYLSEKSDEILGVHLTIDQIQHRLNKEIDNIYIQPIYDFKYYYNTIIENNDCVFDRYVDKYGDIRAITGI